MTIRIIIYFLLFYMVSANANPIKDEQPIMLKGLNDQAVIKLPWSECTDITGNFCEKKLSFSEKQMKKEKKIHKQYEQYYLTHNSPANFSVYFIEKQTETTKAEMLISGFLKLCEGIQDGKDISNSLSCRIRKQQANSLSYRIRKQQEQWFNNDMKNEYYKIYNNGQKKLYKVCNPDHRLCIQKIL